MPDDAAQKLLRNALRGAHDTIRDMLRVAEGSGLSFPGSARIQRQLRRIEQALLVTSVTKED